MGISDKHKCTDLLSICQESMEHDQSIILAEQRLIASDRSTVKKFTQLFGEAVKAQRVELGLKQGQLAQIVQSYGLQVSQSYISRLESGQREEPSIHLVVTLAILLNISIDQVILFAQSSTDSILEDESQYS